MFKVGQIHNIIKRKKSENVKIKRLSVNSITLDYSLWKKVGQTILNLFIGSNRVIVFSESSIVRSSIYFFAQDSPIPFQWSVVALFQYAFVRLSLQKLSLLEVTS